MKTLVMGPTDCSNLSIDATRTMDMLTYPLISYGSVSMITSEVKTTKSRTPDIAKPVPPWHRKYKK